MRSMWLVELVGRAYKEVKLRAHSFVCSKHARLRKSTVNIDVAGKRARESVENWILLVFISRLGWHLRVRGKTLRVRCDSNKNACQQVFLLNVRYFYKFSGKKLQHSLKATSKELSCPESDCPESAFECYLKTISDRIQDTFLWFPYKRNIFSIQYLRAHWTFWRYFVIGDLPL